MSKGIYAALSGAIASSTALDLTAENLANASTTGYRKLRPVFREVLERESASQSSPGQSRFTKIASTTIDMAPGALRSTGRALDVALPEGVFLAVSARGGERYSRAGSIALGPDGALSLGGASLIGEDGEPLHVDAKEAGGELAITADGEVVRGEERLGRLKLVRFADPGALTAAGASLYEATAASGEATITTGDLAVGTLEESNASPIDAMSELVKATRTFEAYERAIDAFRDADRRIVNVPSA